MLLWGRLSRGGVWTTHTWCKNKKCRGVTGTGQAEKKKGRDRRGPLRGEQALGNEWTYLWILKKEKGEDKEESIGGFICGRRKRLIVGKVLFLRRQTKTPTGFWGEETRDWTLVPQAKNSWCEIDGTEVGMRRSETS